MASYVLTLNCWLQCGGEKGAVAAAEPYLKLMGKNVVNCGQSGNGQAAKVCFTPLFHSLYHLSQRRSRSSQASASQQG